MTQSPPATAERRPVSARQIVWLALAAIAGGLVLQRVGTIVLRGGGHPVDNFTMGLFSQIGAWAAVLPMARKMSGLSWTQCYALGPFRWRVLAALVPVWFGGMLTVIAVISGVPWPAWYRRWSAEMTDAYDHAPVVSLVLIALVIAPMAEELFFRGWMLRGLAVRFSARRALIVSSLLFALVHLNPTQVLAAFSFGLLLGWIVLRTNSVVTAVIGHAAWNAMTGLPWERIAGGMPGEDPAAHLPSWLVVVGVMLLAGGLLALRRALQPASSARDAVLAPPLDPA